MNEDESYSLDYLARQSWINYNPKWLLNKADKSVRGESDFIYDVTEVREAYIAGFEAGVIFKITKEIPEVGEKSFDI